MRDRRDARWRGQHRRFGPVAPRRDGRLFGGVRAPSTLGTYLRSFTHGHVQQLDAVASRLLGLALKAPGLLAGGGPGGIAFLDVDDSIREVHGYAKQGAAYGYTGVRGLNFQVAALSTARCYRCMRREQCALKTLYLVTRSMDPKGTGQTRWVTRWKPALNGMRWAKVTANASNRINATYPVRRTAPTTPSSSLR